MAADFLLRAIVYSIYQDCVASRCVWRVTRRHRDNKYGAFKKKYFKKVAHLRGRINEMNRVIIEKQQLLQCLCPVARSPRTTQRRECKQQKGQELATR